MKMKNCSKYIQLSLVVLIVVTISTSTIHFYKKYIDNTYKNYFNNTDDIGVVSNFSDYSYFLDSDNKLYKTYFRKLQQQLSKTEIDEEEYAKLVSYLFLIDFYTLNDKMTNQDIGGVQYIYSTYQDTFREKATDTIYKYLENNLYNNREQELPEVLEVSALNIEKYNYNTNNIIDYNAYKIECNITYKKDLEYANKVTLILVHEGIKISIVEIVEN